MNAKYSSSKKGTNKKIGEGRFHAPPTGIEVVLAWFQATIKTISAKQEQLSEFDFGEEKK